MTDLTPVLDEIRDLRNEANDRHVDMVRELTTLQTHVYNLVGNGQPGKIQLLEDRLKIVEADMNQELGRKSMWVSFGALITSLGMAFLGLLRRHA